MADANRQASPGRVPLSLAAVRATVTRFAPSPTGHLHLGHVGSALEGWRAARHEGGSFLLRIEDIDQSRCREEYTASLLDDLVWLGLDWDRPVRRQSQHLDDYRFALDQLAAMGVLYPCFCTRREIQAEIARAGGAPQGEAGPPYPGTCRSLSAGEAAARQRSGLNYALRLHIARALALTGSVYWVEEGGRTPGPRQADPTPLGDVVLARKDTPASYHLSVTLDDAIQGVTLVTRGEDLTTATHVHRVLQALLRLPTPRYRHHPLLTDTTGRRLSKRDGALTIRAMRQQGMSAGDIIGLAEASLNQAGGGDQLQPRGILDRPGAGCRAAGQNRESRG
jgi:glutamyl-Q tRNA(Asp) synthetase